MCGRNDWIIATAEGGHVTASRRSAIDEEGIQYEAQENEKLPYKLSDDTLYRVPQT